jgi:hypothetical protein
MPKYFIRIALIIGFLSLIGRAYSQNISLNWDQSYDTLRSCIDEPALIVDVSHSSSIENFIITLDFPGVLIPNNVISQCGSVSWGYNNGELSITLSTTGTECILQIPLTVICDNQGTPLNCPNCTIQAALSDGVNTIANDSITANVSQGRITWQNPPSPNQGYSYIGALVPIEYNIACSNGSVEELSLDFTIESEVILESLELILPPPAAPIALSPLLSQTLNMPSYLGGSYFNVGESVTIKAYYRVTGCTTSGNSSTTFTAGVPCTANNNCSSISTATNLTVQAAGQKFLYNVIWKPTNQNWPSNWSSTPAMTCETFDLAFLFRGKAVPTNPAIPDEAGIYNIHSHQVDLNTNLLNPINTFSVNDVQYPFVHTPGLLELTPLNGGLTRVKFVLDQFAGALPLNWPLSPGNDADVFNGLYPAVAGNPVPYIILSIEGLSFRCAPNSGCNTPQSIMGSCQGGFDLMPNDYVTSSSSMCSQPGNGSWITRLNNGSPAWHSNTTYIDSPLADLDNGGMPFDENEMDTNPIATFKSAPVNFYFQAFTNQPVNSFNPWRFTLAGQNSQLFNCTSTQVNLVIRLTPWLSLGSNIITVGNTQITIPYTPIVGNVDETIVVPIGSQIPSGNVQFMVINDACVVGSFGYEEVCVYYESRCVHPNCAQTCPITVGCQTYSFYVHCTGGCGNGFPVETTRNGFKLNRYNYGWWKNETDSNNIEYVDIADGDILAADTLGFATKWVYECDTLKVFANGVTNTYFSNATLNQVFFDIYQVAEFTGLQYLDFSNFTGTFTIRPEANCSHPTITLPVAGNFTPVLMTISGENQMVTRIPLPYYPGFDDLLLCEYQIELEGFITAISNAPDGHYPIQQIRGEFGSVINSNSFNRSCDSWGNSCRVLATTVDIDNSWVPIRDPGVHLTYGSNCSNCYRKYVVRTNITGGINASDDFPNEIRPLLEWPDQFTITNVSGMTFSHAYYRTTSANETYSPITANTFIPVTSNNQGGVIDLTGIDTQAEFLTIGPCLPNNLDTTQIDFSGFLHNDWPMQDKDGSTHEWLVIMFEEDCPIDEPGGTFTLNATFKEEHCENERVIQTNTPPIGPTTDELTLTTPSGVLSVNTFENPVNLTLLLEYPMAFAPAIPNGFIYFPVGNISNLSITPNTGIYAITPVDMGGGLWHLGGIHREQVVTYQINFDLSYECDLSSVPGQMYTPVQIPVYFGFQCGSVPVTLTQITDGVTSNDPCFMDDITLTLQPQPNELTTVLTTPVTAPVEPCTPFELEYVISSVGAADLYDVIADFTSDLQILSAHVISNYPAPGSVYTINGPFGSDLVVNITDYTNNVLEGHQFSPPGESATLILELIAPCDANSNGLTNLSVAAEPLCGIPLENNVPHTVPIAPLQNPEITSNHQNPINCVTNLITIEIADIASNTQGAEFTMLLPDNIGVNSINPAATGTQSGGGFTTYTWNFNNPGTSISIEFEFDFPDGFCDNFDVLVEVASQIGSCTTACSVSETFNFDACCSSCTADFEITQLSNCCFVFEDLTPGVLPCQDGGWGIFTASDTTWVAMNLNSATFPHCFEEDGEYLVCNTVCCPNGELHKTCELVTVTGCSCDAQFEITQVADCCFTFEDQTPGVIPCADGGWGIFTLDETWIATYLDTDSVHHCFETNGDYLVCNTSCCENGDLDKHCELVSVTSCDCHIDMEVSQVNDCCYRFAQIGEGTQPCEVFTWSVRDLEGNILHTQIQGEELLYCFNANGTYNILLENCCGDEWVRIEKSVTVEKCDCKPEFEMYVDENCCHHFIPNFPVNTKCENDGWFIYDMEDQLLFSDSTSLELIHCFPMEGTYRVCMFVCCKDGEVKKFCKDIEIRNDCCTREAFFEIHPAEEPCCFRLYDPTSTVEECRKWDVYDEMHNHVYSSTDQQFDYCLEPGKTATICLSDCCLKDGVETQSVQFCQEITCDEQRNIHQSESPFQVFEVMIFPNPNTGSFTLQSSEQSLISRAYIYDAIGNLVHTHQMNEPAREVHLRELELASGYYTVHVQTTSGIQKIRCLITR